MASVPSTGYRIIKENRRHEDYRSLKQRFQHHHTKEHIFSGSQNSVTVTAIDGSDVVIGTMPAAEEIVYLRTEADDANQDLKSVWVVYQDDEGVIHGPIEHLLNDTADTTVEACLGNEDVNDTVAGIDGTFKIVTLTALAGTLNQYAGKYMVVMSGDQKGTSHLINSNTAATPTVLTLNTASAANLAADLIQIQEFPCADFYRMREMYCEVEPIDDKQILLCNHDGSVIYGAIAEGGRYSAHSGFFTQPVATCKSFLGRVRARSGLVLEAAANDSGQIINITFTPKEAESNGGSADITMSFQFTQEFDWEPCIELEPATDVIISITDITTATLVHVEATYLEIYA